MPTISKLEEAKKIKHVKNLREILEETSTEEFIKLCNDRTPIGYINRVSGEPNEAYLGDVSKVGQHYANSLEVYFNVRADGCLLAPLDQSFLGGRGVAIKVLLDRLTAQVEYLEKLQKGVGI